MRLVQRASALLGWLALLALGTASLAESAGMITDAWREDLASIVSEVADPDLSLWVAALLGAALAAVAVAVAAAQFAPARRRASGVTIDRSPDGTTDITSSTLYRSVGARLESIPEVHTVKPVLDSKRLRFQVEMTDTGNCLETADRGRKSLDAEFWSTLGIEAMPVDLIMTYRRGSTPVARKETLV